MKQEQNKTGHTLSDIAKGIQYTVNAAQDVVEKFYIKLLDRYFDDDQNPISMGINIAEGTSINIPLITLVTPTGLELEELEVEMDLRIDAIETKQVITKAGDEVNRASFNISFASGTSKPRRDSNMIELKMKFKKGDAPEGIQRIIESFANNVIPKDN